MRFRRIWTRIRSLAQRRRFDEAARKNSDVELREFVYLDEVSVYSLLTSRIGAVADEYTDHQADALRSNVNTQVSAGSDLIGKGTVAATLESTRSSSSQVLRRATIQSTFREFRRIEAANILPRNSHEGGRLPTISTAENLDELIRNGVEPWVVNSQALERGTLVELNVKLRAENLFEFATIVQSISEAVRRAPSLIPAGSTELQRAEQAVDLLHTLMVGLVPLEGLALDYSVVDTESGPTMLHHAVLHQLPEDERPSSRPLYIVGVAEESLFWRDLRRVLFSGSSFRMLVRVSRAGLQPTWNPVKLADLLGRVSTDLPLVLNQLGEDGAGTLAQSPSTPASATLAPLARAALLSFADQVVTEMGWKDNESDIGPLIESAAATADLNEIESRRAAFDTVLFGLEELHGAKVDRETIPLFREVAMKLAIQEPSSQPQINPSKEPKRAVLDSEIIAIFW